MQVDPRTRQLFYPHSEERVREDFEALRGLSVDDMVDCETPFVSRHQGHCPMPSKRFLFKTLRTGQMLAEYHHWRDRAATSTKWRKSARHTLAHWARHPEVVAQGRRRLVRAGMADNDNLLTRLLATNSALMTMTHFRATVSKCLCDLTRARSVLDFSAGWGDRLTGFLAAESVTHITLIDPRASSIAACKKQHAFVRSSKTLRTLERGAEQALPGMASASVDLIVTSPPYLDLEEYGPTEQESRGQVRTFASTSREYLDRFLYPVLSECARVLRPGGGLLALNIDDHTEAGVRVCREALQHLRGLRLELVGTCGLRKAAGFGAGQQRGRAVPAVRAEPVYLFCRR